MSEGKRTWETEAIETLQKRLDSLEQKLWGLVAAVFLVMAGGLFREIASIGDVPSAPVAPAGGAVMHIISVIGG